MFVRFIYKRKTLASIARIPNGYTTNFAPDLHSTRKKVVLDILNELNLHNTISLVHMSEALVWFDKIEVKRT